MKNTTCKNNIIIQACNKFYVKNKQFEENLDKNTDIIAFNNKDSILNAPYGQKIFSRIAKEKRNKDDFLKEKKLLMSIAKEYFNDIEKYDLSAIISIDNYTASFAAAAHFPALGVPMGYKKNGQPQNLTFIAPSKKEQT